MTGSPSGLPDVAGSSVGPATAIARCPRNAHLFLERARETGYPPTPLSMIMVMGPGCGPPTPVGVVMAIGAWSPDSR